MGRFKDLSDYDNYIISKIQESKLLLIDLDGTLIDFEKIDNLIISALFPDSNIIHFMDKILWKINKLDILGNGYAGLKIRLAVYSLFDRKVTYAQTKQIYSKLYKKFASKELVNVYNDILKTIISNGYEILIATKNVYAEELLKKLEENGQNLELDLIVLRKDKRKKFEELISKYSGKICVIGNNLSDDIISSIKIGSPFVYIGKSKAVNFILQAINTVSYKFGKEKIESRGVQLDEFSETLKLFKK